MISTLWISITGKNYFDINQEYEGYIDSEGIQGNFLRQNILYLDKDGGYMEVCIYQDSLNYIFNVSCILLYVSYASIKLIFLKVNMVDTWTVPVHLCVCVCVYVCFSNCVLPHSWLNLQM